MRNRKKYPKHWRGLANACKEAANWQCSKCGIPQGTLKISPWTGKEWPVWLQAAHVNHDQANETPELICVCPACHWRYYRRPGQSLTNGVIEQRKHRIALETKGYNGPWRPVEAVSCA
jgi:hypothetical protein